MSIYFPSNETSGRYKLESTNTDKTKMNMHVIWFMGCKLRTLYEESNSSLFSNLSIFSESSASTCELPGHPSNETNNPNKNAFLIIFSILNRFWPLKKPGKKTPKILQRNNYLISQLYWFLILKPPTNSDFGLNLLTQLVIFLKI